MKIVAIKELSAGNDSVGQMWKETKIFESTDSLGDVMKWVKDLKTTVIITIPQNDWEEAYNFFRKGN